MFGVELYQARLGMDLLMVLIKENFDKHLCIWILESLNLLTLIFTYETLTDFALKEAYKRLQLVEDKLIEIDSLID